MTPVRTYSGWESVGKALGNLYTHFLLAVSIALLAALLVAFAGRLQKGAAAGAGASKSNSAALFVYCLCFTTFGIVTAYFLAQGLVDERSQVSNTLLASFAAPFVALLTGGVTFVAAKTRADVSRSEVVLGTVCFLIACVVAYEAFKVQYVQRAPLQPLRQGTESSRPAAVSSTNATDNAVDFDPGQIR